MSYPYPQTQRHMSIMNIKSNVKLNACMVLFITPLIGGGCQVISQTTESEYKAAILTEKPTPVLREKITIKDNHASTDLNRIALKSMQIAEDKATQNNSGAIRQQAELQRIVEQYLNH